ncbi:MAG TPA: methylated-DNA--[protein]-cysteine S-methyltransferase [Terriglobia bacterium]|nr:methylated-DNA--[protein]-cysteine S-methyltransferase [Terriglobia bacterium]
MRYATIDSPLGALTLASTEKGLASIHFGANIPAGGTIDEGANREAIEQLREYFEGKRIQFDLSLDLQGTPFQLAVWRQLQRIPYGETRSYGDIARSLGKPGAARAVGMANHENPVAVVVPCHRVVGSDGSLTGYAGGLHIKQRLLALEMQTEKQSQLLFT